MGTDAAGSDTALTHVVIVGGGFGGVACAKQLAGQDGVRVTLLDKNGFHQFQPLLYQVATAELTAGDASFDLDGIFVDHDNVDVRMAEVVSLDPATHSATLSDGSTVSGDVLVISAGAQANFFDTPGAEEFAFPLYGLADAERVRSRILQLFSDASKRSSRIAEGALNFVVVGAGATGVEVAGALAELVFDVMPLHYADVDISAARVIVVDLGHAPLGAFSDAAHAYASKQLDRRGVELMLGSGVAGVGRDHVTLTDGTTIKTHLTVWGGGEKAASVIAPSGLPVGRGGRITVEPDLTVDGFPGVYAVGDAANIPSGSPAASGDPAEVLPQLGSVAQQAGSWAGQNILAGVAGKPRTPFHYHDKGIMAMIGRKAAVAEIGEHRHELHGRVAFATWLGVHAALLANIRAECGAFLAWAEEFYVRPNHRSAALLDPDQVNLPRIHWGPTSPSDTTPASTQPKSKDGHVQ